MFNSRNGKSSNTSASGAYHVLPDPPSPAPSTAPILPHNSPHGDMSYYSSNPPSPSPGSGVHTPSGPDAYRHPTANAYGTPQTPQSDSDHGSYGDVLPSQGRSADALYSRKDSNPSDKEAPFNTPQWWAAGPEDDDGLHDPNIDNGPHGIAALCTWRGLENLGCMALLILILITLFAGYPIISAFTDKTISSEGGFNLGGVNASGQLPDLNHFSLIDADTPQEAYYWTSMEDGAQWELVFSDEFNRDGRTFYPGDDPYWEAVDLHYWGTNNKEWYDPQAVSTKDGKLVITFSETETHGMQFRGGMIATWNQFCFTGGYIEAAVSLPATSKIPGMWPAVWTMGNLGRAGYGGSLDGTWPYTYDSCDVGTLKNQTLKGDPAFTKAEGDKWNQYHFSYLPGQRLSACTCPDDPLHPGPKRKDGTFVGRAAPEIDMIEATIHGGWEEDEDARYGQVSLSGQWAPFNPSYEYVNTSTSTQLWDTKKAYYNDYLGGVYQQATSVLGETDPDCYTGAKGCFSRYGFEYATGDDGYITWLSNGKKTWTLRSEAMGPNTRAKIGQRLVSVEPMYIIINLGLSENFGAVDYDGLGALFPVEMWVDYVRVYQDPKKRNIGCDPKDFPTAEYIAKIPEAFQNPNITTFAQLQDKYPDLKWPKNRLIDSC